MTAHSLSKEDITQAEIKQQSAEFLREAKDFLCGKNYFEVYDTFDTILQGLNKVLGRKKRPCSC